MMKFRKTKGVVTGLLTVALSFTALGAAQAAPADAVASGSITVKVNEQFTLSNATTEAPAAGDCESDYTGCTFVANGERIPETDPTAYAPIDASISQVGEPVADVITFTGNTVGTYTINITGTRIIGAAKVYESTWTVKVVLGNVVDVAAGTEGFSTLVAAVTAAGLGEALSAPIGEMNPAGYTVFAPTNAAFAKLDPVLVRALLLPKNKDLLVRILKYHVVPTQVYSGDLNEGSNEGVATLDGTNTLSVVKTTTNVEGVDSVGVTVNGANVVIADVPATNGVIHAIDTVLLPSDIAAAIPAFMAPSIKVSITGYAYNAKGKSTRDDKRAAAVERFLKSFTSGPTVNAEYAVAGTVLKKASKKSRSAVVTVTKTLADGSSTQGTTVIYFKKNSTSLTAASKASLKAFFASLT